MWPNTCVPSIIALATSASRASDRRLTLERVENFAAHYPRTLREWSRRLEARLTPAALGLGTSRIAPATSNASQNLEALDSPFAAKNEASHIGVSGPTASQVEKTLLFRLPTMYGNDQAAADDAALANFKAIKRKWQYMFAYSIAGYAKGHIGCRCLRYL
jgi:cyclopropane-fatty-acyl-phospholipid synthase